MYGEIFDWHTLEGPCVRKHSGRYYCFYSGGRWSSENYGVDYGVADSVMGPYSDAGNEAGPRVLRSIPGRVLGPGHNSIVVSPDGQTEYIVYHAWGISMAARQMCLDKLIWTLEGPRCDGPHLDTADDHQQMNRHCYQAKRILNNLDKNLLNKCCSLLNVGL
jgi:beta-xylosidase